MNHLNIGKWINLKLALRQTEAEQVWASLGEEDRLKSREILAAYVFHNEKIPAEFGLEADIALTTDEKTWLEEFIEEVAQILGDDDKTVFSVPLPQALSSPVCKEKWNKICEERGWSYVLEHTKKYYYARARRRDYIDTYLRVYLEDKDEETEN